MGTLTSVTDANTSITSASPTVQAIYATYLGGTGAYQGSNAGSDYTIKSGTLTFAPGVSNQSVSITVLNDSTTESNETINLTSARRRMPH